MPKKPSNVDVWLRRETPRVRKALESASRYFDTNDRLTVNTLEAVYGRESSFGTLMRERGSSKPAGHFHLTPETARRYGLVVSRHNDQRFDLDRAASVAARYLKDLNTMFGKKTALLEAPDTIPVKSVSERKQFVLGAYNGGEGRIARAQHLAEKAGHEPQVWSDVQQFLEAAGASATKGTEIRGYVEMVPLYEVEFAQKSLANKHLKQKTVREARNRCTEGHWVTIDDRPVFICA